MALLGILAAAALGVEAARTRFRPTRYLFLRYTLRVTLGGGGCLLAAVLLLA